MVYGGNLMYLCASKTNLGLSRSFLFLKFEPLKKPDAIVFFFVQRRRLWFFDRELKVDKNIAVFDVFLNVERYLY